MEKRSLTLYTVRAWRYEPGQRCAPTWKTPSHIADYGSLYEAFDVANNLRKEAWVKVSRNFGGQRTVTLAHYPPWAVMNREG